MSKSFSQWLYIYYREKENYSCMRVFEDVLPRGLYNSVRVNQLNEREIDYLAVSICECNRR